MSNQIPIDHPSCSLTEHEREFLTRLEDTPEIRQGLRITKKLRLWEHREVIALLNSKALPLHVIAAALSREESARQGVSHLTIFTADDVRHCLEMHLGAKRKKRGQRKNKVRAPSHENQPSADADRTGQAQPRPPAANMIPLLQLPTTTDDDL